MHGFNCATPDNTADINLAAITACRACSQPHTFMPNSHDQQLHRGLSTEDRQEGHVIVQRRIDPLAFVSIRSALLAAAENDTTSC
jgi:hypothetical protein